MNNYNDFGVKDWLEDPKFRNWIYRGEANRFWLAFLENTPSQHENIEQAKNILLSVRGELDLVSEQEVKARISSLMNAISDEDKDEKIPWWKGKWLQVAAVVLLITAGLGGYYWKEFFPGQEPYYVMLQRSGKADMQEVINAEKEIKLVNLPDGSSVVLKPNARICYPREFNPEKREVYLLGEAFFEVEKNPDQPFFVYAGEMITRVTGTSFSIQANERGEEISLVVKTGTVKVSASDDTSPVSSQNKTITLIPNHLITLNRKNLELKTREVDSPVLISLPIESQDFTFRRTPLKEAFDLLEKTYGVRIHFDKKITEGCTITAQLGDEPVLEKLDMICAVVNARYESGNGIITIFSNGCKE